MKIGILTHPLRSNYGGILQAYALQTFLQEHGHQVLIIDRRANSIGWKRIIKKILYLLGIENYSKAHRLFAYKTQEILRFTRLNFKKTAPIISNRSMQKICERLQFDAVIVGSDQVWRYDFAIAYNYNYFLDFISDKSNTRKIAYAASFGLDIWEYTQDQTQQITALLSQFRAVSVREEQAVELCYKHLCLNVEQTIDPTLLLNAESYDSITAPRIVGGEYVFIYWLGTDDAKKAFLSTCSLDPNTPIVEVDLRSVDKQISIEYWLSYIKYASMVITDSFHGCAFSLIYRKQFVIANNSSGGYSRICSLLKLLGQQRKLTLPLESIDYAVVDLNLKTVKSKSVDFILNSLS